MDAKETIESVTKAGIDRREFTLRSLLVMLAAYDHDQRCGGGGGGSPTQRRSHTPQPTPQPSVGDRWQTRRTTGQGRTLGEAHGRRALTLDIRGQATHPHTVQLAAAEVASIAAGQRVTKESSSEDGHTHAVSFN